MPEPFVHVDEPLESRASGDEVTLDAEDDHHLRSVLRRGPGDRLVVSDGRGRFAPAVVTGPCRARLSEPPATAAPLRPRLHVVQAIPKGRKADDVVRVLTELGVERITLVTSERTVVQLPGPKADRATRRWRAIARAAAGQARRPWLPEIAGPAPVTTLLPGLGVGLAPHVGATAAFSEAVPRVPPAPEWAITIGPEGGWSDVEVEAFLEAGLHPVSLGPSVLRTEHAAAVAVAAVGALTGRLSPPAGPWPPPAVEPPGR